MLGKALYTISLDGVNYKKGEVYEIKSQVNIAGRNYFEILKQDKKENKKQEVKEDKKNKKQEVLENPELKEEEKEEEEVITEGENFENLEK